MDFIDEGSSVSRTTSSLNTVSSFSNIQNFQMNPAFERSHARKRLNTMKSPHTRYYFDKMDTNWETSSQNFEEKEIKENK